MKLYPESAELQFEFDKIKITSFFLLCKQNMQKKNAVQLRIHTKKEFITLQLQQAL